MSCGWSCQDSTKSKLNSGSAHLARELRYKPTLVRELWGARQITTAWPTPSPTICRRVCEMNGRQFLIPMYTGIPSSFCSNFPCPSVISVSGERPTSAYRCFTSSIASAGSGRPPVTRSKKAGTSSTDSGLPCASSSTAVCFAFIDDLQLSPCVPAQMPPGPSHFQRASPAKFRALN